MLAKTKIHLRSEGDDDDLVFSPIADFGYFNHKTARGNRDAGKATVYIRNRGKTPGTRRYPERIRPGSIGTLTVPSTPRRQPR